MQKLEKLRSEIDDIDSQLITLLWRRFWVVEKVGKLKKKENISILQEDRWNALLDWLKLQWANLKIPPGCIENIWNEIHKNALDIENKI